MPKGALLKKINKNEYMNHTHKNEKLDLFLKPKDKMTHKEIGGIFNMLFFSVKCVYRLFVLWACVLLIIGKICSRVWNGGRNFRRRGRWRCVRLLLQFDVAKTVFTLPLIFGRAFPEIPGFFVNATTWWKKEEL